MALSRRSGLRGGPVRSGVWSGALEKDLDPPVLRAALRRPVVRHGPLFAAALDDEAEGSRPAGPPRQGMRQRLPHGLRPGLSEPEVVGGGSLAVRVSDEADDPAGRS